MGSIETKSEPLVARKTPAAIAALLILGVSAVGVYDHDLWNPHEHRVGAIVKEMADSGDYVLPTLNGDVFLEKPPLYYVTGAMLLKLLGGDPARTIRLASVLFGVLTIAATARVGALLGDPRVALASAASLAAMAGFLQCGHFILVDSALTAFVALSFWALVEAAERTRPVYYLAMWVFAGGAFLSKGFIGPCLFFPAAFLYLVRVHGWRQILRVVHIAGSLLFAAVCATWLLPLAWRDHGQHFKSWLIQENLARFTGTAGYRFHHEEGFFFYIPGIFLIALPWSIWLIAALISLVQARRNEFKRLGFLSLSWVCTGLILLSVARTKREIYAYPLMAGVALFLGGLLANRSKLPGSRLWSCAWAALAVILVPSALVAHGKGFLVYRTPLFTLTAGGIAMILGLIALHYLHRRPGGLGIPAFWLAPCVVLIQAGILFIPPADEYKSFRPAMLQIAALFENEGPIAGWRLGETLLGSISFHGGRRINNIKHPGDLHYFLEEYRGEILILEDKRWPFCETPQKLRQMIQSEILVAHAKRILVTRPWAGIEVRKSN